MTDNVADLMKAAQPAQDDDDRHIAFTDLNPIFGWPYSRLHTRRLVKSGRFPAPRSLSGSAKGRKAWRLGDLRAHFRGLS